MNTTQIVINLSIVVVVLALIVGFRMWRHAYRMCSSSWKREEMRSRILKLATIIAVFSVFWTFGVAGAMEMPILNVVPAFVIAAFAVVGSLRDLYRVCHST